MKIYGYLRISKDTSDTENQLYQVEEYCMKTYQRLPDETIEDDVISGKTKACDRKLGELLNKMAKDDILIIASTSRYGRNFFDVMQTASILYEKEAKFYAIQQNFEFSKQNPLAKPFLAIYAWMDEAERENTSKRNKAVIEREKAAGTYSGGRPEGTKKQIKDEHLKALLRDIKRGEYRKNILAEVADMSLPTFRQFLKNNPDIEQKRLDNVPNVSRNGRNIQAERRRKVVLRKA